MSETAVWLRLTAALGALALGVAAVAIVAVLAHRTPGPDEHLEQHRADRPRRYASPTQRRSPHRRRER